MPENRSEKVVCKMVAILSLPQYVNAQLFLNLPTVSTMGSFFTMAFLDAIRWTPMANVTVTTIGRPSGMAATAKLKGKQFPYTYWL